MIYCRMEVVFTQSTQLLVVADQIQMDLNFSYVQQRHLISTIVTLSLALLNLDMTSLRRLSHLEREVGLHKQRLSLGKKEVYKCCTIDWNLHTMLQILFLKKKRYIGT